MNARAAGRSAAALVLAAALAGCSQTAALAPVGGDRLAEVRFAALDVLTQQQVAILVAPVCTATGADDAEISCTGTTTDGRTIGVTSTATDRARFEVTVGESTVFTGDVLDVLQSAAQGAS